MHLKEQWIREGFSSYYVVKKEQKLTYEKNILCNHTLPCLLPCEFRIEDGEEYYYYETGIYTKLKDRISMLEPKLFFAYLLEVFEQVESYLLELDHLKLELESMFLDKEDRPVLCYLPEYEKKIDEQLRDFLEECIENISGDDKKRVRFYYEFHSFLVKEKPNMEQMKDYLEIRPEKMYGKTAREAERKETGTRYEGKQLLKNQNMQGSIQENMQKSIEESIQGNIRDSIKYQEDPYGTSAEEGTRIYEKTPKRILILIGKMICVVGCVCSIFGIVHFTLKILEYGFYYLFLIGSLVSIAGLAVSVYGCYKLWKKKKNPKLFVDFWQENGDAMVLLDEQTTLLEDEDDRTVLLLEEPIGRLIPKNPEQKEIVLNDDGFVIGSSMQGTDYQLEGTGISRRHIRFYKEDKNVCCEDLDSTNGIKINGVKLDGRKSKKAVLKDGDCIKIGLEEFYFRQD